MKKLLIVEDNDDMILLYQRLFRKMKGEIELSTSDRGENALKLIPQFKPDLMIIDISLPGISGLELTRRVRKQYPAIKIIIVTAHEESRYYDEAIRSGADDLVSKEIGKNLVDRCKWLLSLP